MKSLNRIKKNYDCVIKSMNYNSNYQNIININNIRVNNSIELKKYIKNELNKIFNSIKPDIEDFDFDVEQYKNNNIITDKRNFIVKI